MEKLIALTVVATLVVFAAAYALVPRHSDYDWSISSQLSRPKSHNHCAEVLVAFKSGTAKRK